jgi:hypothetical protein
MFALECLAYMPELAPGYLHLNSSDAFSEDEIEKTVNLFGALPEILLDYYNELGNFDFNY